MRAGQTHSPRHSGFRRNALRGVVKFLRHSCESRNPGVLPGKSFSGIERFWIPAFAGMTETGLLTVRQLNLTTIPSRGTTGKGAVAAAPFPSLPALPAARGCSPKKNGSDSKRQPRGSPGEIPESAWSPLSTANSGTTCPRTPRSEYSNSCFSLTSSLFLSADNTASRYSALTSFLLRHRENHSPESYAHASNGRYSGALLPSPPPEAGQPWPRRGPEAESRQARAQGRQPTARGTP